MYIRLRPGASGPDSVEWRQGLDAMLSYARKKGWVDADGRIRAHIETAAS